MTLTITYFIQQIFEQSEQFSLTSNLSFSLSLSLS